MKKWIWLMGLLLLMGCQSTTEEEETGAVYRRIDSEEAKQMIDAGNVRIIDVREPSEYAEKHIAGAELIPLGTIQGGDLSALPDKDEVLLVYCRSGNRSRTASEKLVAEGYTNVYDFGGIIDWPYEVE